MGEAAAIRRFSFFIGTKSRLASMPSLTFNPLACCADAVPWQRFATTSPRTETNKEQWTGFSGSHTSMTTFSAI
jgi:hypothetical protein